MNRIKWYTAEWPITLQSLSSEMLKRQYKNSRRNGFILEKSTTKKINGKFVSAISSKETIEDPFGNISESTRITYNIVKFKIQKSILGLTIIDPPRSSREFINTLHDIIGLGFSVSEIEIDPMIWLKKIESHEGKAKAVKIEAIDINIQNRGLAKIEVSGVDDIRNEFRKFIQEKYHRVNFIKFNFDNNSSGKIILKRNASIKLDGNITEDTINSISNSLADIQ